jgi:glucose/mannose-6-phosphate isomerase
MLDDLKLIHERDPQDALGIAGRQWQYLLEEFTAEVSATDIANVVLAGMGGSALPGVLLNSWPRLSVPFEIVRSYNIPPYVNERTLFISSSFSGNTEETLSALTEAEQAGAKIVVVASGGKLADIAKDKNYPLFVLPAGIQPRMATLYFLKAFVRILAPLGLTTLDTEELSKAADWLKSELEQLSAVVPTDNNVAKQVALELIGKTPIIYSGPLLFPAANKWKICLNENAKNTSWSNQYPEFNHNEFIGWSSHPIDKPFAVVEIRSNLEHERVQKRFIVSERLLSGKRPAPTVVEPRGESLLQQLLWAVAMGDFVGSYTAILNGINPTPVDLVEKLKTALNE